MGWDYIYTEREKYDGCVPVEISTPSGTETIFIPPWEHAEAVVDDVVAEVVKYQHSHFPHLKIDDDGNFYEMDRGRMSTNMKKVHREVSSIPAILKRIENDYPVGNYWSEHRETLKKL
jgi:hypothetical protein